MPDSHYKDILFVEEVIMILHFSSDEDISVGSYGIGQQESSRTSAQRHFLNKPSGLARVHYAAHLERLFHLFKEVRLRYWFWQCAYNTRTNPTPCISQLIEIVGRLLVGMRFT